MKFIPAILILLLLYSCDNTVIYQESLKITDSKWDRNEVAEYNFEVDDSLSTHSLYLMIRHAGNYPYQNLYLFIRTKGPRNVFARDTAQMIFANEQGNWLGKGIGDIYDYKFKFKEIDFPYRGEYSILIEQAMRDEKIEGVTDIGIEIKKEIINE